MAKKNADAPKYSKETYKYWYESMQLQRKFEEKCGQLYGMQKIKGFCHLYIGQEACSSGSKSALIEGDKYITAYRDHGIPLALGTSPNVIMAELYGKITGASKGKGGSMHIFDKSVGFVGGHGIVGAQIPLGAGLAFAEKYKKTGNLSVCYFGDGAVRQGALHETFNMAMLWKLPVVFIVENNGYAMGTSVERTANHTDIWKLGLGYEMPCGPVDGMNPVKVAEAMHEAIERARRGDGPTFLEMKTYRYRGHSMSDAQKYRTKEEVNEYRKIDPITQVKKVILENDFASEEEILSIDASIKSRVLDCQKFAEESPYPEKSVMYDAVYEQDDYNFISHKLK